VVTPISCAGYAAPQLGDVDQGEKFPGIKEPTVKKPYGGATTKSSRQKGVRVEEKNGSGVEDGGNTSPGDSDAEDHPFNRAHETSGDEPTSSSGEGESLSHSDSASVDKKAPSVRKPSQNAIKKGLNEVRSQLTPEK
jgi:hypothetical protein